MHTMSYNVQELSYTTPQKKPSIKCLETLQGSLLHEISCLGWEGLSLTASQMRQHFRLHIAVEDTCANEEAALPSTPACYVQHTVNHPDSLMVWGCFAGTGLEKLCYSSKVN